MNGDLARAQAALAESSPQQPWELQVSSCLKVMCTGPDSTSTRHDVTAMIARFVEHPPKLGYAVFRAQFGLTVTTLANAIDPDAAGRVLAQVTDEVIESEDGYAAREVLRYHDAQAAMTGKQRAVLTDLVTTSGLGTGTLPEPLRQSLLDSTQTAAQAMRLTLRQPDQPAIRVDR
jgi:hypothetical protein